MWWRGRGLWRDTHGAPPASASESTGPSAVRAAWSRAPGSQSSGSHVSAAKSVTRLLTIRTSTHHRDGVYI